jgi:hypothetical protein
MGRRNRSQCMARPIENNSSPGQAILRALQRVGTTIIAAR